MLLKDSEKSEEIKHFTQESQDLITEMGNTEIFEFYETSSKRQCPEIGIVFCTCGKMHGAYGIESTIIGPGHGQSMRQIMYHKARDMLSLANLPKNGQWHTMQERWYEDAKYRPDFSEHGWTDVKIRQYDAFVLEDHSYEATFEERRRWEKNLIFF